MKLLIVKIAAFVLMTAMFVPAALSAEVVIVEDGEVRAEVILPEDPAEDEQLAADELVEHIEKITGVQLPVVSVDGAADDRTPIRLGAAADEALENMILDKGDSYSSFALVADETGISIRGLNPEGTLFGAYELLEQLGVRWFMPLDVGTVVPENSTAALEYQQTVQVPSMDYRRFQWLRGGGEGAGTWQRRSRTGGSSRSTGRHGIPGGVPGGTEGRQYCLSGDYAPGGIDAVVNHIRENYEPTGEKFYVGMGPNDGGGWCRCDGCRELDGDTWDPLRAEPAMTDRHVWFYNRVLGELEDDYPEMHIVWYVYGPTMWPPENFEPNPRIVHVFAPIDIDRTRGMDNPMSPDRHILRHALDGWAEFDPNEMYYRGYYNNLACSQFPHSHIDRIQNEIPVLHEKGINVMRVEVIKQSWASSPLTPYLASKVWWDVDADVDGLLSDFYEKFFGPAREPMRSYFEDLEAAFRDTPYHTGSSYLYFPIFHQQRRDLLRGHLERAAEHADGEDSVYAERVRMISDAFRRLELFLDLMEARNRHDFESSDDILQEYIELTDEMIDKGWVINRGRGSGGPYFARFFLPSLESGHRRTVEEGDLVKGLPDEWDFLIDPAEIGEIAGYYRAGELGGNWQPLKTSSLSWSDQGLHYYKGKAWYRTQVTIPAEFEGREIYLWFGGVDNAAKVWVNGELLGTNREPKHGLPGEAGVFRPFDFLATDAVRLGEENTVSVKVTNDRLAELGTGGIVGPVMFWSPHDEDWTP